MKLSGFHVSVHSNGRELKEYSIEISPDGKKATCWIPSQIGKEFKVKYRDERSSAFRGKVKSVHVYIDGHKMKQRASLPNHTGGVISGVSVADMVMRPFMFTEIRKTDRLDEDKGHGNSDVKLDNLGTISVRLFPAKSWRRGKADSGSRKYNNQDHPQAVTGANSGRKEKPAEHCLSLGNEKPCGTHSVYHLNYDSTRPELVFEFHYRSAATLKSLGIIPPKCGMANWFVGKLGEPFYPHKSKALCDPITWLGSHSV